jgi:uncharacterized protein YehS (DUF1456 family)
MQLVFAKSKWEMTEASLEAFLKSERDDGFEYENHK